MSVNVSVRRLAPVAFAAAGSVGVASVGASDMLAPPRLRRLGCWPACCCYCALALLSVAVATNVNDNTQSLRLAVST